MAKDNGHSRGASYDPLAQYLRDISSLPTLTREEEVRLARRISKGDRGALRKLVEGNLRFVVNVTAKYSNSSIPRIDLINEGNIGLIKAAENFDPNKGVRFITYAVWWVKAAIRPALARQTGAIGLPLKHSSMIYNFRRKEEDLSRLLGRDPTRNEVAEAMGLSPQLIEANLMAARVPFSLDASIFDDQSIRYWNVLKADFQVDEALVAENLQEEIKSLLKTLSKRDRDVIRMRFGLNGYRPMTLCETGKTIGLSRERIRQIEDKALGQLHKVAKARRLEEFLS